MLRDLTREEFIQRSRDSEYRFIWGDGTEGGLVSISIGPWVCECGHSERSAAKMYDHSQACGPRGQLPLFGAPHAAA